MRTAATGCGSAGSMTASCTVRPACAPHWQARRNALIARARAPVEKVFGTLSSYGYRQRYHRGNAAEPCTAYNLRRAARLL